MQLREGGKQELDHCGNLSKDKKCMNVITITVDPRSDSSLVLLTPYNGWGGRLRLKCDGTRAENIFRLSQQRTSPFKSAGASVQSTAGSRGVCISVSNAGYTTFRGSVRVLATHSIRQFPLHFPSRASPRAITFQMDSTSFYCHSASYHVLPKH